MIQKIVINKKVGIGLLLMVWCLIPHTIFAQTQQKRDTFMVMHSISSCILDKAGVTVDTIINEHTGNKMEPTLTYYQDRQCSSPTTPTDDEAQSNGAKPGEKGRGKKYWVKVTITHPDTLDYNLINNIDSFTIQEHPWDAGNIKTQPTCQTKGAKEYVCRHCGVTKIDSIEDSNAHKWGERILAKEATCSSPEIVKYECSLCHYIKFDTLLINPNAHKWGEWIDSGDGLHCKHICEHNPNHIEISNHDWQEEILQPATCIAKGEKRHTCSLCKTSKMIEIPIDHSAHQYKTDSANKGGTYYTCTLCGYKDAVRIENFARTVCFFQFFPNVIVVEDRNEEFEICEWIHNGTSVQKSNKMFYQEDNESLTGRYYAIITCKDGIAFSSRDTVFTSSSSSKNIIPKTQKKWINGKFIIQDENNSYEVDGQQIE